MDGCEMSILHIKSDTLGKKFSENLKMQKSRSSIKLIFFRNW